MLFRAKNSKKQPTKQKDPQISPMIDETWDELPPQVSDDGLSLNAYAAQSGITEAEVWRRIKRGEIVARPLNGQLLIWNDVPKEAVPTTESREEEALVQGDKSSEQISGSTLGSEGLPPIPDQEDDLNSAPETLQSARHVAPQVRKSDAESPTTELALIIDHLSLAKDENRDILRLTQESIRKITELSDTLIATKDALLEAKDFQIDALKEKLARRDKEIVDLKRANEDLEMLASTMAAQNSPHTPV